MKYIIKDIMLPIDAPEGEAADRARKIIGAGFTLSIYRKSLDMRKRERPLFVYSVLAENDDVKPDEAFIKRTGASALAEGKVSFTPGSVKPEGRIGVIGFGPAGMFAALLLAENGYRPIVFERGDCVEKRTSAVDRFVSEQILDIESNIQFGAGGAGTFSDGKLVTRINDPLCGYVLSRLHEMGAPADILTCAKPHIGTDVLRSVVSNITDTVIRAGGEIRFRTKITKLNQESKTLRLTTDSGEEICCDSCVMAIGHSARDTYNMLYSGGVAMEPKAFSVGVRIEHLQSDIDRGLYGSLTAKYNSVLPKGEYALSTHEGGRGVYTFCMCPGGTVVAAASEDGGVCTNGMSCYSRDGINANAAVAVSVTPADYGSSPLDGVELQRKLEREAFKAGGSNYYAPVQTVGDFLSSRHGTAPSRVIPSYMNGKYTLCDLRKVLPEFAVNSLDTGLRCFGGKLPGFCDRAAVLTGIETRTSSPLRIVRGEDMTSASMPCLYPCGEGAGYAGGIMSASVDGIRAAVKVMSKFKSI